MTYTRNPLLFRLALALALGTALPDLVSVAHAQGAGEQATNEIVVTARRIEERLQDVPISITVMNEKQLEDRNITYAEDLVAYTPSLSANEEFGSESTVFGIRGFNQDVGTNPTVAAYFADVVAPRAGYATSVEHAGDMVGAGEFFDLQNLQVLKGPQGTLFGRNTTGGAVLLVPVKPKNKFEGYAEVSAGNFGMERFQGVVNVPLGDKVRIRVGVDQQTRDGYSPNISGIGPSAFNNVNYVSGRVSAVVDVTDEIQNYTIGSFTQSDNNGPLEQVFQCYPNNPSALGLFSIMACNQYQRDLQARKSNPWAVDNDIPDAESYLRKWQVVNTTTWSPTDNLTVKNIASYAQLVQDVPSSLFGTDWSFPTSVPLFPGFSIPTGPLGGQHVFGVVSAPYPGLDDVSQETFTEELQAHGNAFDGRLDWQAGIYIEGSHPLAVTGTRSPSLINCPNPYNTSQCFDTIGAFFTGLSGSPTVVGGRGSSIGTLSTRDYGIYGQATYTITDQLKFTGGLRVTEDISNAYGNRYTSTFPLTGGIISPICQSASATVANLCGASFHTEDRAPTWLLDLDYTPVEDVLTYIKYARGYRAGGITPTAPDGFTTYQPEQVDTYEIGAKTSFHGSITGTFDIAGFDNEFSNQQILAEFIPKPTSPFPESSGILNAGSSRIWGTEISTTLQPYKGVTLSAEYSYLNSKVITLAPVVLSPANQYGSAVFTAVAGSELTYTPRNKAVFTAAYSLPIDPALGRLTVSTTFTYTGQQLISVTQYGTVPSTRLLNFNVDWDSVGGKPIDASFFVTNVTNVTYATGIADLSSLSLAGRNLGPPRMFGGRLKYRF